MPRHYVSEEEAQQYDLPDLPDDSPDEWKRFVAEILDTDYENTLRWHSDRGMYGKSVPAVKCDDPTELAALTGCSLGWAGLGRSYVAWPTAIIRHNAFEDDWKEKEA